MDTQLPEQKGFVWNEEYSVGVKEIDDQHKQLFIYVNELMEVIRETPDPERVRKITEQLIAYKISHFATEEKYFHEFNYAETDAHEAAHRQFDKRIKDLQAQFPDDVYSFAFGLVDFLEDWLIGHLMGTDKKYVKCFAEHGLH